MKKVLTRKKTYVNITKRSKNERISRKKKLKKLEKKLLTSEFKCDNLNELSRDNKRTLIIKQ